MITGQNPKLLEIEDKINEKNAANSCYTAVYL